MTQHCLPAPYLKIPNSNKIDPRGLQDEQVTIFLYQPAVDAGAGQCAWQ